MVSEDLDIEKIWWQTESLTELTIGILHERNEALTNNMLLLCIICTSFLQKCEMYFLAFLGPKWSRKAV